MNTGAQTCVIHRVMKIAGVVWRRSSGWNAIAAACTKSRVWSSAMITMMRPRRMSTACTRAVMAGRTSGVIADPTFRFRAGGWRQ
jgi:hypothetical protein